MAGQESKPPMFCPHCMTVMLHPPLCGSPACKVEEGLYPERQEHLPRHYLLLDRYYIGRVLGQGGFGVTYLALDKELDRKMAIKEYLPREHCSRLTDRVTVRSHSGEKAQLFSTGLQGFLNEAKNIARLDSHPNVVSITDHVKANGTAYMVMHFVPGKTLKDYLADQGGRIPYPVARDIMLHVMSGLRKAHQHGVLHRDISPDNIMVSNEGLVKIIDFGAARQASGELANGLTVILKPGYAPEEQYRSRGKQGPWTDVYAVAATLYRCITGVTPPDAHDRLAEDELVRPSAFCPNLPPSSEAALLKGLAVRAADRYQSIDEFQVALLDRGELKIRQKEEVKVPDSEKQSIKEDPRAGRQQQRPEAPKPVTPEKPPFEKASAKIDSKPVDKPSAKPWFLAPVTLTLLGIILVAVPLIAFYVHKSPPIEPQRPVLSGGTSVPARAWDSMPYNDPALDNCGGVQECLDRKTKAEALIAVRDWAAVSFDSNLFADCMSYQPCVSRSRHRTELSAVTNWDRLSKKDPILSDCMKFAPCLQRKEATVSTSPKPEGNLESFGNYTFCKESPVLPSASRIRNTKASLMGPAGKIAP